MSDAPKMTETRWRDLRLRAVAKHRRENEEMGLYNATVSWAFAEGWAAATEAMRQAGLVIWDDT